jgi:hypothetical protein
MLRPPIALIYIFQLSRSEKNGKPFSALCKKNQQTEARVLMMNSLDAAESKTRKKFVVQLDSTFVSFTVSTLVGIAEDIRQWNAV